MTDADIRSCVERLEATGDYRVLRRLRPRRRFLDEPVGEMQSAVFLDVETTGLDPALDAVIELAMVRFSFDGQGRVAAVEGSLRALEDPGRPIPPRITALTGITDEMVAGQRIDEGEVGAFLEGAGLVVAHNASFDRPFAEARLGIFCDLPWACSVSDVPWQEEGVEGAKLEYLAYRYGFFFDGHRALNDCLACVELLAGVLPISNRPVLAALLESSRRSFLRLWAEGSPFERKDQLKARRYKWHPERRCWWKVIAEEDFEAELDWLEQRVYGRRVEPPCDRLTARERYSPRFELA